MDIKFIALRAAGFNNINLNKCDELGITVVRVPAYSPTAVAEHALALLMCLNRQLHHAYNRNRDGNFTLNGLVGFDIRGKTVGVIGTGKIKKHYDDIDNKHEYIELKNKIIDISIDLFR
jgi:D-lactate dehydrogenase